MGTEVQNAALAESIMGRWSPSDLAFVERIELGMESNSGSKMRIVGLFQIRRDPAWPVLEEPMHRVTIEFNGVSGLRLQGFGGGYAQVMGFDIHSIADRGWDGIAFEVEDYEDGKIKFYCGSVKVVEVESAARHFP